MKRWTKETGHMDVLKSRRLDYIRCSGFGVIAPRQVEEILPDRENP